MKFEHNAKIDTVIIGYDDSESFVTVTLRLDYGDCITQMAPLYNLGGKYLGMFIKELLDVTDSKNTDELTGKIIRVRGEGTSVCTASMVGIGHPLEDRWFIFKEKMNEWKSGGY